MFMFFLLIQYANSSISNLYSSTIYVEPFGQVTLPMNNCSSWSPNGKILKCYLTGNDIIQIKSVNNFVGIKLYSAQPEISGPILRSMISKETKIQDNDRISATFIGAQVQQLFIDSYNTKSAANGYLQIFRTLGYQPKIDSDTLEIIFTLGYIFN